MSGYISSASIGSLSVSQSAPLENEIPVSISPPSPPPAAEAEAAPVAQAPGMLAAAIENPPAVAVAAAVAVAEAEAEAEPQPAAAAVAAAPAGVDPALPNDEDVPYRRRVMPGAAPQPLMDINVHTPPTPPLPPENPESFDQNFNPVILRPSLPDSPGRALNLRPININFTLEDKYDHFSRINQRNLLYAHTGDVTNQVPPITFTPNGNNFPKIRSGSHFRVAERNYIVLNIIGNPGAYGAAYTVRGNDGQRYIMKVQKYRNRLGGYNIFKEAICQYIVNRTSFHRDHVDCSFTPAIIAVGKYRHVPVDVIGADGEYIFILMEYIDNVVTLGDYLAPHPFQIRLERMHDVIIKIARKLQPLYRYYKFNHGDLHYGNILVQHPPGGSARTIIIDFGFTSMKIGNIMTLISPMTHLTIPGAPPAADPLAPYLTAAISPGRDLTYLITSLYNARYYNNKVMQPPIPLLEMFVLENRLVRTDPLPARHYRRIMEGRVADGNLANHQLHHIVYDLFNEGGHNNWAAPGRILRHFNNRVLPINEEGICDPILDAAPLELEEVPFVPGLAGGAVLQRRRNSSPSTRRRRVGKSIHLSSGTRRKRAGNSPQEKMKSPTRHVKLSLKSFKKSKPSSSPVKMTHRQQSVYISPLPHIPLPEGLPRFQLTAENIADLSIENVFHHLRFDYTVPKELLIRLAYVPIREEMESFLLAYNAGQDAIIDYLEGRPTPIPSADAVKSVADVFDLYYMVDDREIALTVLTSLVAQPIYNKTEWETYKKWFVSNIKTGSPVVSSPTVYGAQFI